jgi:hypothetical protein
MKCFVTTLVTGVAVFFALLIVLMIVPPAIAQEGAYHGTYFSYGTFKTALNGKERGLSTFDENGISVSDGFLDHLTWHCWGLTDRANGMFQNHGNCVATDPAGDQLVADFGPDEKHAPGQKSWSGPVTFTTGTGKFAGVSGGGTYVIHGLDFRPGAEGTYFGYNTLEGHYKLAPIEAAGSSAPPSTAPTK